VRTLDRKVVVVTGAGSGLGRAIALRAAGLGARVAVSDVDEDALAGTVSLLEEQGAEVHASRLDVADTAAWAAYAAAVVEHFGTAHVLVSNAGVALVGDLVDLDESDLEWIVGVNLWGVVHGTRAFLPHLVASGDGHVVTISSLFGLMSVPGQSMYHATKYAVRGLSESLRQEMLVAGHPVGVTVVHPGGVRTGIARHARHARTARPEERDALVDLFDRRLARMSPDRAAQVVLDGVLRGKPRVLVGLDAHVVHQMARLAGARYQDVVAAWSRRLRSAGSR
jgi:NADP-dependent 3-hydroxy acid dehydrogenase YdfG